MTFENATIIAVASLMFWLFMQPYFPKDQGK
jgi:hypothetical protein